MKIETHLQKARFPLEQRIAELERELEESARLHGMGSEREARLEAKVAELEGEVEQLRGYIRGRCECLAPGMTCDPCHFLDAARGASDE
jgi:hypothetical protein